MKNKRGCSKSIGVAFLGVIVLVLGLCLIALLYLQQQEQVRTHFDAPIVLITEPVPGTLASTGSYVTVSATAMGRTPITRVELWMDGELKETQNSDLPEGSSSFNGYFMLLIPSAGPHFISARAVNALGIIGNSLPVGITGTSEPVTTVPGGAPPTAPLTPGSGDTPSTAPPASGSGSAPSTAPPAPGSGGTPPIVSPTPRSGVHIPNKPPLKIAKPPLGIPALSDLVGVTNPPAAPTDLQGQVVDCNIVLRWNDNATNETRYEVWTALGMLSPQVVASLEPSPTNGLAWHQFNAPYTILLPTGSATIVVSSRMSGAKRLLSSG